MSDSFGRILYFVKRQREMTVFFSSTKEKLNKALSNLKISSIGSAGISDTRKSRIISDKPTKFRVVTNLDALFSWNYSRETLNETIKKIQRRYVEIHFKRYYGLIYFNSNEIADRFYLYKLDYMKSNIIERINEEFKTEKMSTYIWLLFWLYIYSKKRVRTRKWACFPAPLINAR